MCDGEVDKGQPRCWSVLGEPIDRAIEQLFLQTGVPDELELSLAVDKEVSKQAEALAQQWRLRIEKAQYEARKAERRYKAVDPDNLVVARTLEREWEEHLRALDQVERDYERARSEARVQLTEQDRARIRTLAADLKTVWNASTTQPADRKAMLALVFEAVVLRPVDVPRRGTAVRVQWKAGAIDELQVRKVTNGEQRRPGPQAMARLRELVSEARYDADIAQTLNAEGLVTGDGLRWTQRSVGRARRIARIQRVAPDLPRSVLAPEQLPDGRWSVAAAARRYGVSRGVVREWIIKGEVRAEAGAFPQKPNALWLTIDEATDAHIRAIVARAGRAHRTD